MPERWVVNASPLIVLAKIDHQELLSRLADEILVPQPVVDEINADPVDDPARRCAHSLSIPVIGTLGIIIRARRAGLIDAVVPVLKALQSHDFHLDEKVIRTALRETAGEIWD